MENYSLEKIFYYYGFIYILLNIIALIKRFVTKHKEINLSFMEDLSIKSFMQNENRQEVINKHLEGVGKITSEHKISSIIGYISMVWMLIGCFTEQKIYFIILLFYFNIISGMIMVKTKTHNNLVIFVMNTFAELFIASLIMYNFLYKL
jgi:hypothetical protein